MASSNPKSSRRACKKTFRIGKVRAYRRGKVWYLCYREQGRRRQPRIGPDQGLARQTASEINAQLEVGLPSALGFEPISITELRQQWLDHHEHIRRSSVRTIERYRAATNHLLRFIGDVRPIRRISDFRPTHAEEFVRYLRSIRVAPNGHANAAKRRLRETRPEKFVHGEMPLAKRVLICWWFKCAHPNEPFLHVDVAPAGVERSRLLSCVAQLL